MKISKIKARNVKKLVINQFFPEEQDEIYVTIKKIPLNVKREIDMLQMTAASSSVGSTLIAKLKEKGVSMKQFEQMTDEEKGYQILSLGLDPDNIKNMNDVNCRLFELIINSGLDALDHSFVDDNDEVIELNYEVINNIGHDGLMNYIVNSIKEFMAVDSLGKLIN